MATFVATVPATSASTITLPSSAAAASGGYARTTVFHHFGRTLQLQVAASELDAVSPGAALTGLAFRLVEHQRSSPTVSDWRITLGQAARPISEMSRTFAENMVNPVLVRRGPLVVARNSCPGPQFAFGLPIGFDTPYQYLGGDLVIQITHTGAAPSDYVGLFDAFVAPSNNASFRALWAQGFNATTSEMDDAFTVVQMSFESVPEPDAAIACGAGFANLFRRRQRLRRPVQAT